MRSGTVAVGCYWLPPVAPAGLFLKKGRLSSPRLVDGWWLWLARWGLGRSPDVFAARAEPRVPVTRRAARRAERAALDGRPRRSYLSTCSVVRLLCCSRTVGRSSLSWPCVAERV